MSNEKITVTKAGEAATPSKTPPPTPDTPEFFTVNHPKKVIVSGNVTSPMIEVEPATPEAFNIEKYKIEKSEGGEKKVVKIGEKKNLKKIEEDRKKKEKKKKEGFDWDALDELLSSDDSEEEEEGEDDTTDFTEEEDTEEVERE